MTAADTRTALVEVAERLFAAKGIDAVGMMEVAQAAGQRNKNAVGYHIGDRSDLVLAILAHRVPTIESRRNALREEVQAVGRGEIRDSVEIAVRPLAEVALHPWGRSYAGFLAQLLHWPRLEKIRPEIRRIAVVYDEYERAIENGLTLDEPLRSDRIRLAQVMSVHGALEIAVSGSRIDVPRRTSNLVDMVTAALGADRLAEETQTKASR